jgi:hypothetical protein
MDVWSAAALQAKNEDDGNGLRECIRSFVGVAISWPEWNALRSRPFYFRCLCRHFPHTGFGSAGIDRFAISWFASKPGRNLKT